MKRICYALQTKTGYWFGFVQETDENTGWSDVTKESYATEEEAKAAARALRTDAEFPDAVDGDYLMGEEQMEYLGEE